MKLIDMFKNAMSGSNDKVQILRNTQALDSSSTSFMMADENRVIIYVNDAVQTLLKNAEQDIRQVLPQFSANNLIGQSIDQFHRNASHQKNILANLSTTLVSEITVGTLTFRLTVNPLFDENKKSIGSVVEWLDQTELVLAQVTSARMLGSLDTTSTNIMLADSQRNIIYMNKSVEKMLRGVESELRKELPNFSVDKILNGSMDVFHKNPAHQASLLDNLSTTYEATIQIGRLKFRLITNPIFDDNETRLGTVVEWLDVTTDLEEKHRNARTLEALEVTTTNLMIADPQRNIVYMNASVTAMLKRVESEIRKELPNFSVDKILNGSMDVFHKNPAHQSSLLANLSTTYEAKIQIGSLQFRLIANPIFDENSMRLGTVIEWLDITHEMAEERRVARVLEALNGTSTNLMIADAERNILYMNKSVQTMFRRVESELRKELPHFDVNKIIGSNIDIFHKNPSHQKELLERLQTPYTSQIQVGKLYFRLIASPIFDEENIRIGTVVEWLDRTGEVNAEEEVSRIVTAAVEGDFTERAEIVGKTGFMLNMAKGLNSLIQTTDQGLDDIARVLNAIAAGNMNETIKREYQGTFALLANSCNTTTKNLSTTISEIRQAADVINSASGEISQGNSDLSSRTEEQASSLEQTAVSMEELTETVRLNSKNASQANSLASEASTVAIEGGDLIQKVVKTMSSINESARKIADIIGVIDGIAFQTNILALNAAVEAARAGEQGRGFAVVASEVRSLAQRSANAAKDIKELISDSVQKIENGNQLVNQSGDTMDKIVTSIKRVNDLMAEIAAASAEQSTGIDEVSKAVSEMDEVTQQNAALVEEAAAAAESLQSQAEQLTARVAWFKVDDSLIAQEVDIPGNRLAPGFSATKKLTSSAAPMKRNKSASSEEDEWDSF
jgi:methyl-accepting chemotaxis protein